MGEEKAMESKPSDQQTAAKKDMKSKDSDIEYPSGLKFALLIVSIFGAMFLVSLDKLIISTAIPKITDTFNSPNDVGWYGTAYLLTNCAFQLVFGKVYKFFPVKTTFLTSIVLFEAGSAICGAAPNSIAFILGRAIAGLGAGGVLPGVMTILVYSVPMQKRPKYQGFFGAIFGVASVLGPTVGGAFTTRVTWRWCFTSTVSAPQHLRRHGIADALMLVPIGGVMMALVFFLFHMPERPGTKISLTGKLRQLNALGLLCLVPGIVCLCIVLQWGGTIYSWSNGRIIALFVIAFSLLIAFALIQVWLPEQAILPPRLFVQRSIASGFWTSLCIGAHQTLFLYYLPIWFQAIDGKSAVESGVDLLPMVLPIAAVSIANGQLISRIGYYTPSLILGVCLTAVGAGLLTTFGVHTSEGKWIGYQILYGFGLGLAAQAPNMAAQTVLPKEDVAIGASLMFFGQTLFGAVFVSVGENVLIDQLVSRLASIPGISSELITSTGATEILDIIDSEYRSSALVAYNYSLRRVFQVALGMACLAIPGALCMEWRTVREKSPRKSAGGEKAAEEGKGQGKEVKAEASAVNDAGEKQEGKDTTVASSTGSSDAANIATPSEGKHA